MSAQVKIFLSIIFIGLSNVQSHGRTRGMHSRYNLHQDSCSCSCDDLGSLFNLARALDDKDSHIYPPPENTASKFNAEDLIMKLINALIDLSTQTAKNNCHCSHPSNVINNGYQSNGNANTPVYNTGSAANGNPNRPIYNAVSSFDVNPVSNPYNSDSSLSVNPTTSTYNEGLSTHVVPSILAHNGGTSTNVISNIPDSSNINNFSSSYTHLDGGYNNPSGGNINGEIINKEHLGASENNNILDYNVAGHPYGVGNGGESANSLINNTLKDNSKEIIINSGVTAVTNATSSGEAILTADYLSPRNQKDIPLDVAEHKIHSVEQEKKKEDIVNS